MKRSLTLVLLIVPLWAACAGRRAPLSMTGQAPATTPGLAPVDYSTQKILRVKYQGEGGQLHFRLVARLTDDEHYQLSAADPIGRPLWALEYDHPEVHFIDHRAGVECRTRESLAISELALETLALKDLPAVLAGRLPKGLIPPGGGDGQSEFLDPSGRKWTVVARGSAVERWTMWAGEKPLLWYQAVEKGGILSHRGGSQFRWRLGLSETMDVPPEPLRSPRKAVVVDCDELARAGSAAAAAERR